MWSFFLYIFFSFCHPNFKWPWRNRVHTVKDLIASRLGIKASTALDLFTSEMAKASEICAKDFKNCRLKNIHVGLHIFFCFPCVIIIFFCEGTQKVPAAFLGNSKHFPCSTFTALLRKFSACVKYGGIYIPSWSAVIVLKIYFSGAKCWKKVFEENKRCGTR